MSICILVPELLCSISHFITVAAEEGLATIEDGDGGRAGDLGYASYYGIGKTEKIHKKQVGYGESIWNIFL